MEELIGRQLPGASAPDDYLRPTVGMDLLVRLAEGESVQWRGFVDVSLIRYNRSSSGGGRWELVWDLVEIAEVLITNTRLTYRANTLSRRSGVLAAVWEGITVTKSPTLSANAHIGQVRFEWVSNVFLRIKSTPGLYPTTLQLTCIGQDSAPMRIKLSFLVPESGMSIPNIQALTNALVSGIARHRLATRVGLLSAAEIQQLTVQRDGGRPVKAQSGSLRWDLTGWLRVSAALPAEPRPAGVADPPLVALMKAIDALALPEI
jgi:hypothetical protein